MGGACSARCGGRSRPPPAPPDPARPDPPRPCPASAPASAASAPRRKPPPCSRHALPRHRRSPRHQLHARHPPCAADPVACAPSIASCMCLGTPRPEGLMRRAAASFHRVAAALPPRPRGPQSSVRAPCPAPCRHAAMACRPRARSPPPGAVWPGPHEPRGRGDHAGRGPVHFAPLPRAPAPSRRPSAHPRAYRACISHSSPPPSSIPCIDHETASVSSLPAADIRTSLERQRQAYRQA